MAPRAPIVPASPKPTFKPRAPIVPISPKSTFKPRVSPTPPALLKDELSPINKPNLNTTSKLQVKKVTKLYNKPSKPEPVPVPAFQAPPTSNLPTLFDPKTPVSTFKYTDYSTPEDEHNQLNADMNNLAVAGLAAVWSQPNLSVAAILKLIRETREMVKHRCKMYNLAYDSDNSSGEGKRSRTILLD